jgi:hypothetical protein
MAEFAWDAFKAIVVDDHGLASVLKRARHADHCLTIDFVVPVLGKKGIRRSWFFSAILGTGVAGDGETIYLVDMEAEGPRAILVPVRNVAGMSTDLMNEHEIRYRDEVLKENRIEYL